MAESETRDEHVPSTHNPGLNELEKRESGGKLGVWEREREKSSNARPCGCTSKRVCESEKVMAFKSCYMPEA